MSAKKKTARLDKFPEERCMDCAFCREDEDHKGSFECWAALPFPSPYDPNNIIRWLPVKSEWPACATFKGKLHS